MLLKESAGSSPLEIFKSSLSKLRINKSSEKKKDGRRESAIPDCKDSKDCERRRKSPAVRASSKFKSLLHPGSDSQELGTGTEPSRPLNPKWRQVERELETFDNSDVEDERMLRGSRSVGSSVGGSLSMSRDNSMALTDDGYPASGRMAHPPSSQPGGMATSISAPVLRRGQRRRPGERGVLPAVQERTAADEAAVPINFPTPAPIDLPYDAEPRPSLSFAMPSPTISTPRHPIKPSPLDVGVTKRQSPRRLQGASFPSADTINGGHTPAKPRRPSLATTPYTKVVKPHPRSVLAALSSAGYRSQLESQFDLHELMIIHELDERDVERRITLRSESQLGGRGAPGRYEEVFGVPLNQCSMYASAPVVLGGHEMELPVVVVSCVEELYRHGLSEPHLFKTLPDPIRFRELVQQFNNVGVGPSPTLADETRSNICAILSTWLMTLPEPIVTQRVAGALWEWCLSGGPDGVVVNKPELVDEERRIQTAQLVLQLLPSPNYALLVYTMAFLTQVVVVQKETFKKAGLNVGLPPGDGSGGMLMKKAGLLSVEGVAELFGEWVFGGAGKVHNLLLSRSGTDASADQGVVVMMWFLERWDRISEGLFELGDGLSRDSVVVAPAVGLGVVGDRGVPNEELGGNMTPPPDDAVLSWVRGVDRGGRERGYQEAQRPSAMREDPFDALERHLRRVDVGNGVASGVGRTPESLEEASAGNPRPSFLGIPVPSSSSSTPTDNSGSVRLTSAASSSTVVGDSALSRVPSYPPNRNMKESGVGVHADAVVNIMKGLVDGVKDLQKEINLAEDQVENGRTEGVRVQEAQRLDEVEKEVQERERRKMKDDTMRMGLAQLAKSLQKLEPPLGMRPGGYSGSDGEEKEGAVVEEDGFTRIGRLASRELEGSGTLASPFSPTLLSVPVSETVSRTDTSGAASLSSVVDLNDRLCDISANGPSTSTRHFSGLSKLETLAKVDEQRKGTSDGQQIPHQAGGKDDRVVSMVDELYDDILHGYLGSSEHDDCSKGSLTRRNASTRPRSVSIPAPSPIAVTPNIMPISGLNVGPEAKKNRRSTMGPLYQTYQRDGTEEMGYKKQQEKALGELEDAKRRIEKLEKSLLGMRAS
ncbi:hypothetical protein FA15DRAFT_703798 [Coprinopsis marcescibilis]|uniref:Rho-GAP domain-containing protein n=1 Tax=Coprinopsis marcescibilis TaxID=230819 RepID=A0A5C3KZX2_COPMA|nr:hypothetical protein FA15DRAFT_703798 [Coprinopsis marcescibilis]